MNPLLTKTYTAGGTISPFRIVKFGASDNEVVVGAAPGDDLIGVIDQPTGDVSSGDRCDVILAGIADVEFGGTVTRGAWITTNATGQAVAATPGADVNVIGRALVSAVSGDIGQVYLAQGVVAAS